MKGTLSGLVLLTVLSMVSAQHGLQMYRFQSCDSFENCLMREHTRMNAFLFSFLGHLSQDGRQGLMKVQQYSSEEDPWNELFRTFTT